MVIRRVRTQSSNLGVLDLDDYEFDPGIKGVFQRLKIASSHASIRFVRSIRFFFTSFLGLHYVYVVAWSLVLSWILYPEHNMTYTDALFQAVSAMTITGLNTVNINNLKLYQQIFLFVTPVFTHPLTIASFMVFYRLYLFRRKFADIEQTSKFQSRLRRATTLSQFETMRRGAYGRDKGEPQPPQAINLQLRRRSESPLEARVGQDERLNQSPGSNESPNTDETVEKTYDEDINTAGPNMELGNDETPSVPPSSSTGDNPADEDADGGNKIRFGALPRPPSREREDYNPREMFRSLNMMRSQYLADEMDEDDGPALVIKSPRDIEADERRGIHSAVASSYDYDNDNVGADNSREPNANTNHTRRFSSTTNVENPAFRPARTLSRADTLISIASNRNPRSMTANYLSWTPTVGHNSAFIGLTHEQKEELGGVEYRALKLLRWITIAYFIIMLVVGWVFLIPWVYKRRHYNELIRSYGVSPVTFAMTTVLSAFNNSGLAILPSSMGDFWHTAYVPVVVSFIVMAGNVAIPIIMRYSVKIVFLMSPQFGQTRETLGFLLDHPRRCFMLLFPSTTTWWLSLTILVFILVETSLFMILDHGDHSPQPDMSAGPRLLSAYFQSIAVRTVGFTIINIRVQAPGMLVLNIVMMYIAIYPVAMSIRKSNVYEEQSLGHFYTSTSRTTGADSENDFRRVPSNVIDDDDDEGGDDGNGNETSERANTSVRDGIRRRLSTFTNVGRQRPSKGNHDGDRQAGYDDEDEDEDEDEDDRPSTLVDHMRRQLSMDVWSLVLGLMLVSISEGGSITRGKFSMFDVIFEVVSAHGTIGWSMGLPGTALSVSGGFSNVGKLVMMAVMIRGRHRAMPYNVDRAIILKGADIMKRDREQEHRARDARIMMPREPTQQGPWLSRATTTASRLTNIGSQRRRSTSSRQPSFDAA